MTLVKLMGDAVGPESPGDGSQEGAESSLGTQGQASGPPVPDSGTPLPALFLTTCLRASAGNSVQVNTVIGGDTVRLTT